MPNAGRTPVKSWLKVDVDACRGSAWSALIAEPVGQAHEYGSARVELVPQGGLRAPLKPMSATKAAIAPLFTLFL